MGLNHQQPPAVVPAACGGANLARAKIESHECDGEQHNADHEPASSASRALMPVDTSAEDAADVLLPHERSPDASAGQKRSCGAALEDTGLLDRPCEKKLKREDREQESTRPVEPSPRRVRRALSPLEAADAEQIRQHLRDVRREVFLRPMIAIVTRLMFHKYNHGLFNVRVDPVEWNIPHYFEIVKNPMDLTLVKTKCLNLEYATPDECAADIRLVFSNACLFNPPGHVVHDCATLLAQEFEVEYTRYQTKAAAQAKRREEHSCPSCLANVCGICNEKCINFEPPLIMCTGPCKQRIKRHAVYYTTPNRAHHWCAKCYSTLPRMVTIDASTSATEVLPKQSLMKAKFVDELTEPWVQCDRCNGWVHQICALFNACENPDDGNDLPYSCPLCRIKELDDATWTHLSSAPSETSVDEFPVKLRNDLFGIGGYDGSPLGDKDSMRILDFGGNVRRRVLDFLAEDSVNKVKTVTDTINCTPCTGSHELKSSALARFMTEWVKQFLEDAGEDGAAQSIVIKVASSIRGSCRVSPIVREHFRSSSQQYPESIDYTSKAIYVFQKLHGIEVCIFSMYVQEYDETASVPANRNRVYIAYIDSLVYMRPRHIRTSLFHQILIGYLAFSKARGFEKAHIWACPTTRGGDFIYWCHPSFQKNPGKDRLMQWYLSMAEKAKKAQVAFAVGDLFTAEFENLEANLENHLPPYFDGDYWGAEVERLHANPPKRGKLSKEVYEESLRGAKFRKKLVESVRLSRDALFVIDLQPECVKCKCTIVNKGCWQVESAEPGQTYMCQACHDGDDSLPAVEIAPPAFLSAAQVDDEEDISCPFLDHRADLLKNCEELHYQFDSYRRAKYSTMMLVYHAFTAQQTR
ncbi:hypothetical protein PINS_up006218 [Pythium insidiosum]|nr:hypothetical protein PINS_up006218 [Pythium insidiosum]